MQKQQLEGAISGWEKTKDAHKEARDKGLMSEPEYYIKKKRIEEIIKDFEAQLAKTVSKSSNT